MNACTLPAGTVALVGATAMETSCGAATLIVAAALTPAAVAVTVHDPCAFVLARPVLEIVTAVLLVLHTAVLVISAVLPSENVPVALNCCVSPSATVARGGLTATPVSTALVTVSEAPPETLWYKAVMVAVPGCNP